MKRKKHQTYRGTNYGRGPETTTMVGAKLMRIKLARIIELLRESKSEFTWSPMDMLGFDLSVTIHKLNLDPNTKKIVQKKKAFILERQKAIAKKIEKLKVASFIREV